MANYRSGFVTLLGRPNVGKSTLINKLIGEKITITSPIAQTTRNKLKGILTTDNGQIIFVGLGKVFQIWDPLSFEKFKSIAKKKSYLNRSTLKWENKFKKEGV